MVDTLLRNANIVPMTGVGDRASAIAITGGRVAAIGGERELAPLAAGAAVLDLAGATVLPGLIDTHVHLARTGLRAVGPSLPPCASVRELVAGIARVAAAWPDDEALLVIGGAIRGLDRKPTRHDLDAAVGKRAVLLADPSAHVSLASSAGLAAVDFAGDRRGVLAGSDGQANGILVTWANKRARRHFHSRVPLPRLHEGVRRAIAEASSRGVTAIHAMDGGDYLGDADVAVLLELAASLPMHLVVYEQVLDAAKVAARGARQIGGCILIDGSYAERTAALLDPYSDLPRERGVLFHDDAAIDAFVRDAHARGLQIAVHAQGDAAVEQILRAYERALGALPRADARHRIEHCGLPTDGQLERIARLGVGLGMQPIFAAPSAFLEALLGPERMARRHRYRELLERGIVVGGGSDADSSPIDPLAGVRTAVGLDASRRLSAYEALELYTTKAAWLAFEEGERGALRPGMLADLAVLDRDPLGVPAEELADIRVLQTWRSGRVVFERDGDPHDRFPEALGVRMRGGGAESMASI